MSKTLKRKVGRPAGIKETRKRVRHEPVIAPPHVEWLDKKEAAGELRVSVSFINRHQHMLGATKLGDLVRFSRTRLHERMLSLPTAKAVSSPDNRPRIGRGRKSEAERRAASD
jgi:hypothetical protein